MKQIIKNNSLNLLITIIGVGIIIAGILTMALYHDMDWRSYVIIGVIMLISLWTIINNMVSFHSRVRVERVRHREH